MSAKIMIKMVHNPQYLYDYFLRSKEPNKKLKCIIFDPSRYTCLNFYTRLNIGRTKSIFIWSEGSDEIIETYIPDKIIDSLNKTGMIWWNATNLIDIHYVLRTYQNATYGGFDFTSSPMSKDDHNHFIDQVIKILIDRVVQDTETLKSQLNTS